jgi:hypothetical protein
MVGLGLDDEAANPGDEEPRSQQIGSDDGGVAVEKIDEGHGLRPSWYNPFA